MRTSLAARVQPRGALLSLSSSCRSSRAPVASPSLRRCHSPFSSSSLPTSAAASSSSSASAAISPLRAAAPSVLQRRTLAFSPLAARGRPSCVTAAASAAADAAADFPIASSARSRSRSALSSLLAHLKGLAFYLATFALAVPLFATMLVLAPLVALLDPKRRRAQHFVNDWWAKASTAPFYRVRVVGREKLPGFNEPAVYVANHQSFLDIYTLFWLGRPFKFISKTSNFLIPIIGWSMFLTGHVRLNRVDRRSQLACLSECRDLLASGAPVLFFPEGTRSKDGAMAEFKKGAFSVAAKAGVPVVPVSLVGTGALMPNGQEGRLYGGPFGGRVTVVVHDPIPPGRMDADAMMEAARKAIAGSL